MKSKSLNKSLQETAQVPTNNGRRAARTPQPVKAALESSGTCCEESGKTGLPSVVKRYVLDHIVELAACGISPMEVVREIKAAGVESEIVSIDSARRSYRVARLHEMAEKSYDQGNYELAASLLEQIAKEMGGFYTNTLVITGPNGGPVELSTGHITPEQRQAALMALLEIAKEHRERQAAEG